MLIAGAIGVAAGGIGGAIYSRVKYGEIRWQNVAAGATVTGTLGNTMYQNWQASEQSLRNGLNAVS